ncbi:unnamed protein product [Psylliodes chrysocephalus]|uniref:Uncharacterized protein n=1 Tax=Psylliodes chrysocephalus TaxID=3402493 RepID=A0A9P0CZ74_9CUCU|nr:unnamed protein product [Psylliodes chrysocephala]
MKCYIKVRDKPMPNINSKDPNFNEISQIVVTKVQNIWKKASIPVVTFTRAYQMLKEYHKKYMNLKKSSHRKDLFKRKAELFISNAKAKLFDLAICKCADFSTCHCEKNEKIPQIEQAFVEDQKTVRKMIIGSIDQKTTIKLLTREQRKVKGKTVQETTQNFMSLDSIDYYNVLEVTPDPDDDDFEKSLSTYQRVVLEKKMQHAATTSNETSNLS